MTTTTLNPTGRRWFNGTFGNLSISPTFHAKLAAAHANDLVVLGDKVEPNIKIVGMTLKTDALGAGTSLSVTVGDTPLVTAQSTVTAVHSYFPVDDVMTDEGQALSLLVGGGVANGNVAFKLHYEMIGNL